MLTVLEISGSGCTKVCVVPGSGAAALAHLDGAGTEDAAAAMVQRVTQLALGYPEGRLELQLVGGYSDPRNYSEELFCNILCEFLRSLISRLKCKFKFKRSLINFTLVTGSLSKYYI